MPLDNNQFDGHRDIAQFLEKFREQHSSNAAGTDEQDVHKQDRLISSSRQNRSFERLEEKIRELEERFEASAAQNHLILSELARTREAMEYQESKSAFIDGLAQTIESLKSSVETLSKAQMGRPLGFTEPEVNRPFDRAAAPGANHTAVYHYRPDHSRSAQEEKHRAEREEKERIISSLHQKASQLKAVNLALDREIKKAQQEKMDALKKSAEQAKEILSLRDQLTAAEERFKSFDFEGRIISIKQEYQQKVTSLENQLREISNTCMKQVEEIESLKAENVKLHQAAEEKDAAQARFEAKSREVEELRAAMETLRLEQSASAKRQLETFSARLRALEQERDELGKRLEQAQTTLDGVLAEKQTLERNFKELLAKIESNDAVIEELKRKIDVLTAENMQLSQEKAALEEAKENLGRENDALMQKNRELGVEALRLSQDREEMMRTAETLRQEKDSLAQTNSVLAQEKETLLAEQEDRLQAVRQEQRLLSERHDSLVREKEALDERARALSGEKDALLAQNETLRREREALNERARALDNEKDDLLARNQTLLQEKEQLHEQALTLDGQTGRLRAQNETLRQEKEALDERARILHGEKEALRAENDLLSRQTQELGQEKDRLELENGALLKEKEDWAVKRERLELEKSAAQREKEDLKKENRELRSQSAALLAVRLADKKKREDAAKRQSEAENNSAPAAPVLLPAPAEPAAFETPVEMQKTVRSKVQTEADLPEIRVADPVPVRDEPFNGEDFLEKTDSFIGRMKWSLFREDR